MRKVLSLVAVVALVATAGYAAGAAASHGAARAGTDTSLPGFSQVVFLSHVNDPAVIPGFPGDPTFSLHTSFTVAKDGFYLQYVKEGEHTGTHYSAPCHFHVRALCADESGRRRLHPAGGRDRRAGRGAGRRRLPRERRGPGGVGRRERSDAAGRSRLLWTGCDAFWGPDRGPGTVSYYTCGSGKGGFHQPGFSLASVKWLIDQGVLGDRGLLGTDTFGPDPGTDFKYRETSLTLHHHRFTLENLTNLGALPTTGSWIVWGGPRNANGSGAPSTVFGLIP